MFYAIIQVTESDMDFGFYKDGKEFMEDGSTFYMEGATPEEAWANMAKTYLVGAYNHLSYLHPDQLPPSYSHVRFMHELMTKLIPEYIAKRGVDVGCPGEHSEGGIDAEGCFSTKLLGNWEVEISVTKEAPRESPPQDKTLSHGAYKVAFCPNGDIKIQYKGQDIVWLDTYYQRPEGQGHSDSGIVGLPNILINAVNNDEPAVSLSVGDDKVFLNDVDKEQTEGKCLDY